MRVFLLTFLCVIAVVAAKKAEKEHRPKHYTWTEKKEHHLKNVDKDHHQKPHVHEYRKKHAHDLEAAKKHKAVVNHAPFSVPHHEARLQGDLTTSKKAAWEHQLHHDQQDLHLQDLTFPEHGNHGDNGHRSPHQYQRGHHKTSHHFAHHKQQKPQHHKEHDTGHKLFADHQPKVQLPKSSHPIVGSLETADAEHENIMDHFGPESHGSTKKGHKSAQKKAFEKTKTKNQKYNKKQYRKAKKEMEW